MAMARKSKTPVPPADAEIDPLIERLMLKAQVSSILNGEAPVESESFHVAKLLNELKLRRLGLM